MIDRQELFGSPLEDVASKQRKRALVPGCGRGYDVLLLASLGYDCYGLDASQTAIDAAAKHRNESQNDDRYSPYDSKVGSGESKFLVRDFFKDDFLEQTNGGQFDVIFDYTFLCALPPEMRPSWAKRMSELLASDGHLICLEWPLGKPPTDGGPPHGLTSNLYTQLFRNPGQDVDYDSAGVVSQSQSTQQGDSLTRIAHFMPSRTHEAGKGKDYVGIWRHAKT